MSSPRSKISLDLGDAVTVSSQDGKNSLQGVVAYLGKVQFAEGSDWVGVRLTGLSAGKGRNDGSVGGVRYFDGVGQLGGVFVRRGAVTRRTLSRLEELRLRRELGNSNSNTGGGGRRSGIAPPSSSSSSRKTSATAVAPAAKSDPSTDSGAGADDGKSRLEKIRERRAALTTNTSSRSNPPSSSSTTPLSPATTKTITTTSSISGEGSNENPETSAVVSSLREQIDSLAGRLHEREDEIVTLRENLTRSERETDEARRETEEAREEAARAVVDAVVTASASAEEGYGAAEEDDEAVEARDDRDAIIVKLKSDLDAANDARTDIESKLRLSETNLAAAKQSFEREKEKRAEESADYDVRLSDAKSQISTLEREVASLTDRASARGASDATHYRERAALQAEVGSLSRRVKELEAEKVDLDTNLEELTLDKEQLQEEKEALEDRLEEMKIDTESAQIEVEELRVELEDSRERLAKLEASGATLKSIDDADSSADTPDGADAEDVAQALSIQNSRLREAILRLREQSAVEKLDLGRQLRAAEKDAEAGRALQKEVEGLRTSKAKLNAEVHDLKEMVDQNAAFEQMVEDLSEKVMVLEDQNISSRGTIREMEEAAEIAAEMEEVQADENKALMRDLEGRDTSILNLEEAIKAQRRREEDFQRTVGNYRSTVERLQLEKNALLAVRDGGDGEKDRLHEMAQKALAQAAQLVSDAAKARKTEASAAFDHVEAQISGHYCNRLEELLPQSVVASEVASIRGELLLSKVACKSALSLSGVHAVSSSFIRKGLDAVSRVDGAVEADVDKVPLSDTATQQIATMIHQTEFARIVVEIGSESLRFLSVGQWPDLLSPSGSAQFGGAMIHAIAPVDAALGQQLTTLKEEGGLSPHRSSLIELERVMRDATLALSSATDENGDSLVPPSWSPPGWEVVRDASATKFWVTGAFAILATTVTPPEGTDAAALASASIAAKAVKPLLGKIDQIYVECSKLCVALGGLPPNDDRTASEISNVIKELKMLSEKLFNSIKSMVSDGIFLLGPKIDECDKSADDAMKSAARAASSFRTAKVAPTEETAYHALSPESDDPWSGIVALVRKISSLDGNADDINFIMRAHAMEQNLTEAVDNGSKLAVANAKVVALEKGLSSRSKEIAIQNARLGELEQLLSQTPKQPSSNISAQAAATSEELRSAKEENRVLTEAMDVLQVQVDEYEREIRTLKDSNRRTPGRKGGQLHTPRKAMSLDVDFASVSSISPATSRGHPSTPGEHTEPFSLARNASLEAALFRPALRSARNEAATWKARVVEKTMLNLPPLFVPKVLGPSSNEEKKEEGDDTDGGGFVFEGPSDSKPSPLMDGARYAEQLFLAAADVRMQKASTTVIDLSKVTGKMNSSRDQLRKEMMDHESTIARLEETALAARHLLANFSSSTNIKHSSANKNTEMLGRVRLASEHPNHRVIPLVVDHKELRRFHSHILQ